MLKHFYTIILLGSLALLFSCQQQDNISTKLFPNPPDTNSFGKFANKLTANEKAWLVADTTYTREGKLRNIGIQEVPQDKDDFRNFGFDGGLLNRKYLRDVDFRGAYFRSAKAMHSDFSYSDFRWANLESARFYASKLFACNFTQAVMFYFFADSARMDSSLFISANMFGMHANDASMRYCNFSNAMLRDADYINTDFTGSIAVKSILTHSIFIDSKMDSMDLSYVIGSHSTFKGASFVNSRLWHADFSETNLDSANFYGADLKNCNFNGANFRNTNFKNAINIPANVKAKLVDDKISGILGN
ncbi:MAG: hypothetical protein DRI86_05105 [Bacteroidetes bacterium]|nr:MAG: hypothetical protein DRI86_05105 [Bacteroidota bacterium]